MDDMTEVKQKHLDCPLVAGSSIGHKSRPLHISGCDTGHAKNLSSTQSTCQNVFSKDGFSRYHHTDACSSVNFSAKFGFSKLSDAIKRGCAIMTDSCD